MKKYRYLILRVLATLAMLGSLYELLRANPFPSLMLLILGVAFSSDARITLLEQKLKKAMGEDDN